MPREELLPHRSSSTAAEPSAAPEQAEQSPTERPTAVLSVCRRETSLSTAWLPKANAHLRLLPHPQCCVLRGDSAAGTRCYGDMVLWGHGAIWGVLCRGAERRQCVNGDPTFTDVMPAQPATPAQHQPGTHTAAHTNGSKHLSVYLVGRYLTWGSRLQAARSPPPSRHTTSAPNHAPCWGAAAPATALRRSPHAAGEAEGPTQGSRQQRPGTNPHPNPHPSCEPSGAGRLLGGGHGVRGAGFIITGAVLCFT